jgi:hypothetical protein
MRVSRRDRVDYCAVNLRLEAAALEILRKRAPGPKSFGRYLARLLYESEARIEERQKLLEQLQGARGSGDA